MKVNLIGFQNLDFVSRDGSRIHGTNLFVSFADDAVTGLKTDKFFIPERVTLPAITPSDMLDVSFNMKGRVIAVEKVIEGDSPLEFGGSFKQ